MKDGTKETARLSFWLLVFYGGAEIAGAILSRNATGAAGVQAVIAELGAGRLRVTWSDPDDKEPTGGEMARRVFRGAAIGAAIAALAIALAAVGRGATIAAGRFSVPPIAGGLVVAALVAVRDELLLRGMVLRVFRPVLGAAGGVAVCAVLAAAARWGQTGCGPIEALGAAALGAAFAGLWLVDRGAFLPVGAHAGLVFTADTLARGTLVDVRTSPTTPFATAWGGGDAGLAAGLAWAVAAVAAAVVVARFGIPKKAR